MVDGASSHRQPKMMAKGARSGPIIGKRAWQVGLAGIVSAALYRALLIIRPPRMFTLHVALMAPMLPLGVAAVVTVRQRLAVPPTSAKPNLSEPGARKRRSEWLVIRHFIASASALYAMVGGLVAIYLQKESRGAAHLTSVHSWLGLSTAVLWLGAYLAAQPQVWRDQIRARKFSLLTNKRWLWASASHRRLGTMAYVFSFAAYMSGMLGWAALDPRISAACCAAVLAIGTTTLGDERGASRGMLAALVAPALVIARRLVRRI